MAIGIHRKPILAIQPGGIADKYPELGVVRRGLGCPLCKPDGLRMIALFQGKLGGAGEAGVLDVGAPAQSIRSVKVAGRAFEGALEGAVF